MFRRKAVSRDVDGWEVVQLEMKAKTGSHFMDILEPTLGTIIRNEIQNALRLLCIECVE